MDFALSRISELVSPTTSLVEYEPNLSVESLVARATTAAALHIYNLLGQKVRTLDEGPVTSGYHEVRWDGRDEDGRPAASGVYLYRIRADDRIQTRKLLLLK